jgi:hypothetical protein
MTRFIGPAIASGMAALAGGTALSRALLRYREGAPPEALSDDSSPLSLRRYSVLTRLAGDEDERFLRTLPGFKEEMLSRLRSERRVILRMYLRELTADFRRLHRAARLMVAAAPQEHADLVGVLMRQQITFWRCLAGIESRLALKPLGLPRVDTSRLLQVVEALRAAVAGTATSPAIA